MNSSPQIMKDLLDEKITNNSDVRFVCSFSNPESQVGIIKLNI